MSRHQIIRGIPFPNLNNFKRENIENTMDYFPKDGDIIIASYPKTGTTWLNYITLQIISKGQCFPSFDDCLKKVTLFMEMNTVKSVDNLTGVRIYKHHYRYNMVKKNPLAKVLYIYRNPADTFISLYNFFQELWEQEMDLDEVFDGFVRGNIDYGSYFEHVLSYLNHKTDNNLLLISYEKLHANTKESILRIARFLGEEYCRNLSEDESLLNKIVENTSFGYMKKNLTYEFPLQTPREMSSGKSKNTINIFRKGTVGDGRKSLTSYQMTRLQEVAEEVLKEQKLLQDWFKE